jgi:hypothetical protein
LKFLILDSEDIWASPLNPQPGCQADEEEEEKAGDREPLTTTDTYDHRERGGNHEQTETPKEE